MVICAQRFVLQNCLKYLQSSLKVDPSKRFAANNTGNLEVNRQSNIVFCLSNKMKYPLSAWTEWNVPNYIKANIKKTANTNN